MVVQFFQVAVLVDIIFDQTDSVYLGLQIVVARKCLNFATSSDFVLE